MPGGWLLLVSPWLFGFADYVTVPHVVFGLIEWQQPWPYRGAPPRLALTSRLAFGSVKDGQNTVKKIHNLNKTVRVHAVSVNGRPVVLQEASR